MYYKKSKSINTLSSFLIKGNTITDSREVSEHFNNFRDLQRNITPTKNHFSDYLKASNTDKFYISPKIEKYLTL